MNEMFNEVIVDLVNVLTKIIVTVIAIYVLPKLNEILEDKKKEIKASLSEKDLAVLQMITREAVEYFEEKYTKADFKKLGDKKKEAVIQFLRGRGLDKFDEEMLDMILENAVKQMNEAKKWREEVEKEIEKE